MEKKSYSYGRKIAGVMMHQLFTITLTVSVFLLGAMVSKDILRLTDIGTEDFFESGYYFKCMEQKCNNLNSYLALCIKGDKRKTKENQRYLQYTNEFKREDSNFCYWYMKKGKWYTNQPDTVEGQNFDTQTILMEAKTMGDYLIYDMKAKQFGTNIKGLEQYFLNPKGAKSLWTMEDNVILVIGVDTGLSANDDLAEACREYNKLYPWIKISIFGAIIGMMGWILSLVYLTIIAGRKDGEGEIVYLNPIDKIKTEFLIAAFVLSSSELILLMARINSKDWDVSGLLVASGSISFLIDTLFLIFYLSMVRRLKAEVLWESSFAFWLQKGVGKLFRERAVTTQVIIVFLIHMVISVILTAGAFYYRSRLSFGLFLLFGAAEAYMMLRQAVEHYRIRKGVEAIASGDLDSKIDVDELHGEDRKLGEAINNIGAGLMRAVDENTKNERMKADLITNVSHDIKTPLTSIINYVNLLKREETGNERINNYVRILDEKSQRLKQLTEDLVEASRISSGNVNLDMQKIDIVELVYQTGAEFNEKFEAKELTIVTKLPGNAVYILADGRELYRVIENLYNNVAKYALEKTRVYVDVQTERDAVFFSIKNVSERSLDSENVQTADLTERFIRGDASRTTEGSGLGLSIAKNLTILMGGEFDISVDGDLFKANMRFPVFSA